jgi:hypothetical protein
VGSLLNWLDRIAVWVGLGLFFSGSGAVIAAYIAGIIKELRDWTRRRRRSGRR